jgi:hypothetical protein
MYVYIYNKPFLIFVYLVHSGDVLSNAEGGWFGRFKPPLPKYQITAVSKTPD